MTLISICFCTSTAWTPNLNTHTNTQTHKHTHKHSCNIKLPATKAPRKLDQNNPIIPSDFSESESDCRSHMVWWTAIQIPLRPTFLFPDSSFRERSDRQSDDDVCIQFAIWYLRLSNKTIVFRGASYLHDVYLLGRGMSGNERGGKHCHMKFAHKSV